MVKISKSQNRIINIITILLYTVGIIAICKCIGIDSDKANHLLQAKDILHGNFFLRDWNLTGITFFTTDLLYYEIAELLFGVGYKAIYIAGGLMISSVLIASYYFSVVGIEGEKRNIRKILVVLLLSVPCQALVVQFRVHTVAVLLCLCMFVLYYLFFEKGGTCYLFLLGVTVFLGIFGDLLTMIEGVIPILVLTFLDFLRKKEADQKNLLIMKVTSISTTIAFACEKIYFLIGNANRNSYIGNRNFTSVSEWGNKFLSFIQDLMRLSMADFAGNNIADIWSIVKGIYFLLLFVEIVYIVRVSIKLIKGESYDPLSALLAISCTMSFLAYMLTDMAQPRYITIIPIAGTLLVVRNIEWLYGQFPRQKCAKIIIIILACIGFVGRIHEVAAYKYPESNTVNYKLIHFLKEHHLTHGYASFWNASNLTVLSNEEVKIRHVRRDGDGDYHMHNWFNKNCWYKEPTNFVLINHQQGDKGEKDIFGVSEKGVVDFWGQPSERYEICGYIVLVYDNDLSETLGVKKAKIVGKK